MMIHAARLIPLRHQAEEAGPPAGGQTVSRQFLLRIILVLGFFSFLPSANARQQGDSDHATCGCTMRSYIIFFYKNKILINKYGADQLSQAIRYEKYRKDGLTIIGYTNLSSNAAENQVIALERTKLIRKLLHKSGIPSSKIHLIITGTSNAPVPITYPNKANLTGYAMIIVN